MNIQNKDNLLLLKEVQDVLNEHDHVELACKIGRLMLDLESFIAEKDREIFEQQQQLEIAKRKKEETKQKTAATRELRERRDGECKIAVINELDLAQELINQYVVPTLHSSPRQIPLVRDEKGGWVSAKLNLPLGSLPAYIDVPPEAFAMHAAEMLGIVKRDLTKKVYVEVQ